jgi:outer membrane immunogenic protein
MKASILVISVIAATAVSGWGYSRESAEEERQEAAIEGGHPVPVSEVFNWSGVYMGIQTSYTRASLDTSLKLGGDWNEFPDIKSAIEDESVDEFDEDGFGLGGCAGYNWQLNNGVVLGVGVAGRKLWYLHGMHETGDFELDEAGLFDVQSDFRTTYLVTFGPKIGYACGRFFPYVTGGVAFGEVDYRQRILSNEFEVNELAKGGAVQAGWTAGAGAQYAFANNWSLKVEYGYSDLGTLTVRSKGPDFARGFNGLHNAELTEHTGNFGIVYNFYGFAPH